MAHFAPRLPAMRLRLFSALLLSLSPLLHAETPSLDYLFPAGGRQGTTNTIAIGGKYDPWPAKVWIDCPGVQFDPQTNKGAFKVSIGTNAPEGPHLVRLFN